MRQMQPMMSTITALLLLALLLHSPSKAVANPHLADCSSCDHSLTQPVYYGCISDDVAYVEFDSVKIECGQSLSLNATSSSPTFHYPDAEDDALYALLMMDTTGIDPIVGTQAPFLPFPIIHYGAMNIPGDVLARGMSLGIFDNDETGVRVRPFLSYVTPVPREELSKVQPGYTPPDLDARAFNYEFMLGKQAYEKDPPRMDKNVNWEFVGFLKRTILGNPIASTYFSTGYCVKDVVGDHAPAGNSSDEIAIGQEAYSIGVDCPIPAETLSGIGSVPAHVAGVGGYGSSLSGNGDGGSSPSGTIGSAWNSETEGSIGSGGTATDSSGSGNDSSSGGTISADGSEDIDINTSSSSGFVNGLERAVMIACMAGLMYGIICV